MQKSDLLRWLQEEYRQWETFLDQFGPAYLDQPDVTGHWSMKDVVAHLAGWNRGLVARLQAAQHGEPQPPRPWPAHLQTEDEINAWIYAANHGRPVHAVLEESQQVFQQLLAVIGSLPDDVPIEIVRNAAGREYYLVWVDDKRFPAGEFFDHFHDEHEPDIRAWLAQGGKH
jgi:hypothetical protein